MSSNGAALKARRRKDYEFSLEYRTRWSDNDMYSHLNNSTYYYLFDAVANTYLATQCGHSPSLSHSIGLVVHSHCDYFAPSSFPSVLDVCMRVNKLGKSSVVYEIAVFERKNDQRQEYQEPAVVGEFVHVFVERVGRRPLPEGMEDGIRRGLNKIKTGELAKSKL